jgi:hypothetical protein
MYISIPFEPAHTHTVLHKLNHTHKKVSISQPVKELPNYYSHFFVFCQLTASVSLCPYLYLLYPVEYIQYDIIQQLDSATLAR